MTARVLVARRIAAPRERVFEAFTAEIGRWWRPNALFRSSRSPAGVLSIEPGVGGRVAEAHPDGTVDEIGTVKVWEPPERLVMSWRPTSFVGAESTEVRVRFEAHASSTRVVVEHVGWDTIPAEHSARHGFPLGAFQHRLAEWWADLLASLDETDWSKMPC